MTLRFRLPSAARLATVLCLVVLAPARAAADEIARGTLSATDPVGGRITVQAADRAIGFAVTPQSRLTSGGKQVPLADLKTGQPVRVTYRVVGGANQVVALRPAVTTDAGLRREVSQALAATKDYTFQQKDEFAARLRGVADDLDDRIGQLSSEP